MIRFEQLCAGFDGADVLHDISVNLPEGKLTALIGPNGCGKSTLLKTAAGLIKPTGGDVFIGGRSIRGCTPRDLAKQVAYMPQSRPAPEMTVGRLVTHGRYPHLKWGRNITEADRTIIHAAMERTDTLSLQNKRIDRLSGGERQRAYIAMMLAQQSPVMLLDEPTTYLDPRIQFDTMSLISDLAREGHTVLAVLHDLHLALEYADHIILMHEGRVLAAGSPDSICHSDLVESVFGIRLTPVPSESTSLRYHISPV